MPPADEGDEHEADEHGVAHAADGSQAVAGNVVNSILTNISIRIESDLAKALQQSQQKGVPLDDAAALKLYLACMQSVGPPTHADVLVELASSSKHSIQPLEDVYVPNLLIDRQRSWAGERWTKSIWRALEEHSVVLVEGQSGVGKATLLGRIVYTLSGDSPAADYAAVRAGALELFLGFQANQPVWDAVSRSLLDSMSPGLSDAVPPDLARRPPAGKDRWLILIDRLDRIPDPRDRARFLSTIQAAAQTVPYRFIITSRPLPPDEDLDQRPVGRFDLAPFGRTQVVQFARKWHGINDDSGRWGAVQDSGADNLLGWLHQHGFADAGEDRPTTVPLLIAMAAVIFERPVTRHHRAVLMGRMVAALLEHKPSRAGAVTDLARALGRVCSIADAKFVAATLVDARAEILEQCAMDAHGPRTLVDTGVDVARKKSLLPAETEDHEVERLVRQAVALLLIDSRLVHRAGEQLAFFSEDVRDYMAASGEVPRTSPESKPGVLNVRTWKGAPLQQPYGSPVPKWLTSTGEHAPWDDYWESGVLIAAWGIESAERHHGSAPPGAEAMVQRIAGIGPAVSARDIARRLLNRLIGTEDEDERVNIRGLWFGSRVVAAGAMGQQTL